MPSVGMAVERDHKTAPQMHRPLFAVQLATTAQKFTLHISTERKQKRQAKHIKSFTCTFRLCKPGLFLRNTVRARTSPLFSRLFKTTRALLLFASFFLVKYLFKHSSFNTRNFLEPHPTEKPRQSFFSTFFNRYFFPDSKIPHRPI